MQINEVLCEKNFTLRDLWNEQHPVMHSWFLLSFLSIGLMSALLFIIL